MEEKKETVRVESVGASPETTLGMIFTVLAMLTWGTSTGIVSGDGLLGFGVLSLAVFPSYLVAQHELLKTGNGFSGNIFGIFCCFFASVAGVSDIMSWASANYGIPFPPELGGILWTVVGAELFFLLIPLWKHGTVMVFAQILMSGVGLVMNGFVGLGLLPSVCSVAAGWLFFVIGLEQLYFVGSSHVAFMGVNLPQGPLMPAAKREQEEAARAKTVNKQPAVVANIAA